MKHRKLLIGSIIAIPVGLILWAVIGPVIALSGISSHFEGWWIFGQTVTEVTTVYWVGVALSIVGIVVLIGGIVGIILSLILEALDRGPKLSVSSTPNQARRFCTNCGNELPANAEYCPKCGKKF